jgi:hypothetical protein
LIGKGLENESRTFDKATRIVQTHTQMYSMVVLSPRSIRALSMDTTVHQC